MPRIDADEPFDPDDYRNDVLGIASGLAQHDSGMHQHAKGQLLFSQQGCMRITLNQSFSLLPPGRVAWIPGGVPHRVQIQGVAGYRSVWLVQSRFTSLAGHVEIVSASPLLREVLERIAFAEFNTDWRQGAAANLLAVCLDELQAAPRELTTLRLPVDRRLRALNAMSLPPPLHSLARSSGASEKTISRILLRETGLSYQQWRQQWRLIKALEMLVAGQPQADIAAALEFASDSAFSAFFSKMTGRSPRAYLAQRP